MRVIIYGDFNCPYSYLASQRADALARSGRARVDWRAVEHDPWLPMTGKPTGPDQQAWARELAEVAALALPGETVPDSVPPLASNTLAAVSAYAEAVTDGIHGAVRRAMFEAIWLRRQHIGSAYDVRAVISPISYPAFDVRPWLTSELPPPGYGDPRPDHITRMLGGTIAANGIPLTTPAWRRARGWRQEWLNLGEKVVPTVVDPVGVVLAGIDGLAYLAWLLGPGVDQPPARSPASTSPTGMLTSSRPTSDR